MREHNFNFNGGEFLTKIGASWLISYLYYLKIDKKHLNWENTSTFKDRAVKCKKYAQFHKEWVVEIIKMSPKKLSTNRIGLSGEEVIEMAKKLLPLLVNNSVL